LTYPPAYQGNREIIAVRAFVRDLKNRDTEQILRLDRCQIFHDALAYALEFEAVKQVSREYARVRQIRTCTPKYDNRYDNPKGVNRNLG